MVIVGFWAEVELNRNLANFISNSSDADAYFRAEQARYRILLAMMNLLHIYMVYKGCLLSEFFFSFLVMHDLILLSLTSS